ncbi:transcriptional regulator [Bradyrhizobium guangdongense]|uniref:transcriptional regulator n=1 Tax=Bradyrhizobium guangdongense TaxID=1325090 RepID=UPI00112A68B4|nr:transcriptional regulator [Bradyrhizobium guangdongense]TPQ38957.1 transcriptional regulator [Bradyrhizobium guangdongense]
MRQELRTWQSDAGSRLWLSALIAAMEDTARPEIRRQAVSADTMARFRAQLALPASHGLYQVSGSGLRH